MLLRLDLPLLPAFSININVWAIVAVLAFMAFLQLMLAGLSWVFTTFLWGVVTFFARFLVGRVGGKFGETIVEKTSSLLVDENDNQQQGSSSSSSSSSSDSTSTSTSPTPTRSFRQEHATLIQLLQQDLRLLCPDWVNPANLDRFARLYTTYYVITFILMTYTCISGRAHDCATASASFARAQHNTVAYYDAHVKVEACKQQNIFWHFSSYMIIHFDIVGAALPIFRRVLLPIARFMVPLNLLYMVSVLLVVSIPVGYITWILVGDDRRRVATTLARKVYTRALYWAHDWISRRVSPKRIV